jgi:alpha-tubulin suppressor-like RCC1 family protein
LRPGDTAALAVVASSALPLTYQWQRNGLDITGATATTYSTPPLVLADNGARFTVVMANGSGASQSSEITLTVVAAAAPPVLAPLPQVVVVAPGQTVMISTRFDGTLPYSYQWLRNGLPIAGAAGSSSTALVSYRTAPQALTDQGTRYALSISNVDGTAQSTSTTLSIVAPARVAAGGAHTLARSADGGGVWAWGDNSRGQLGTPSPVASALPLRVSGLPHVNAIAAGATHSLALGDDGSVWAWGDNSHGALGDGSRNDHAAPQRVAGVDGAVAIAAGDGRSFALRGDGSVLGWGENATGALGLGTRVEALRPEPVGGGNPGFGGIVGLAAGARNTLALRSDGQVFAFGEVAVPLPDGVTVQTQPVLLAGLNAIAAVAASNGHALALDITGRIWAWGLNGSGQLGQGGTTPGATPALLATTQAGVALLPSLAIAVGDGFALALPLAGPLLAWGADDSGQTGSGTLTPPVLRPAALAALPGALSSFSAGRAHAVAVLADGSVYAWGANAAGQLGIGVADAQRSLPTLVSGLNLNAATAAGP